jgi:hypothetical protein
MTSSTVPGPKSRKPGPGKTGTNLGPGRLTRMLVVATVSDSGLDIMLCANKTECAARSRMPTASSRFKRSRPVSMSGNKVRKDTRSAAYCTRL